MDLFWVKVAKSLERLSLYISFGLIEKKRTCLFFIMRSYRLKYSFTCNLWYWTRMSVDVNPTFLISFINWIGSKWELMMIFVLSLLHLVEPFGSQYILILWFGRFLLINTLCFTHLKKKMLYIAFHSRIELPTKTIAAYSSGPYSLPNRGGVGRGWWVQNPRGRGSSL